MKRIAAAIFVIAVFWTLPAFATPATSLGTLSSVQALIAKNDALAITWGACKPDPAVTCTEGTTAGIPMDILVAKAITTHGAVVPAIAIGMEAYVTQIVDYVETQELGAVAKHYGGKAGYTWVGQQLTKWGNLSKGTLKSSKVFNGVTFSFDGNIANNTVTVEFEDA